MGNQEANTLLQRYFSPLRRPCRCHLDMYPHRSPLRSFPRPVLSLYRVAQHPCLPGRPLLAPSLRLSLRARGFSMSSPRPSLRSRCTCSLSRRLLPSPCLPLTHSPEVLQFRLQLQPRSFLQWLRSLLLWHLSSALEPQVELGHSPVKNWGLRRLLLPLAQVPLNPPASPMLSRRRSPECRRSRLLCPHLLQSRTR